MHIANNTADAFYAVVTRAGDRAYPHHGQWGATPVLAMCGALMRAYAARAKSSKSYGVSSNHARTRPHLRPPIAIDLSRSRGGSVARPMGLGVAVRPATEWRQAMRIRRVTCPLLSQ